MIDREARQKKRDAISSSRGGGSDFWKPKDGDNNIRILPYRDKKQGQFWFEETAMHYNMGSEGKTASDCPKRVMGLECPVCAAVEYLLLQGDKESAAQANSLKANSTFYVPILDYDDPEKQGQIQIWSAPPSAIEGLLDFDCDPKWGDGLDDPQTGKVVTIHKQAKSAKNPFVKYTCRPSPADDPLSDEMVAQVATLDLAKKIKIRSKEALEVLVSGGSLEEADAVDTGPGRVPWSGSGAVEEAPADDQTPAEEVPADTGAEAQAGEADNQDDTAAVEEAPPAPVIPVKKPVAPVTPTRPPPQAAKPAASVTRPAIPQRAAVTPGAPAKPASPPPATGAPGANRAGIRNAIKSMAPKPGAPKLPPSR